MSPTGRTALLLSALSTVALAQTAPKLDANCDDVVIFMARGNDAPYHDGRTFPFVESSCAKFVAEGKTCDYIEVEFDVTKGGPYCDQVAQGASNGISQITNFNKKCPCTAIVINGYSEGAHVMGNVLAGPGGCTGTSTGIGNTSAAGKAIAAALLWGDVMHTANQPYNVLDGADKQVNPRPASELARLNGFSSVLRSYCAAGDPVCAGGNNVADHLNYFEKYTEDASSWVVSKVNAFKGTCASPTPSPSTSATPSVTSTSSSTSAAATTLSTSAAATTLSTSAAATTLSTSAAATTLSTSAAATTLSTSAAATTLSTSAAATTLSTSAAATTLSTSAAATTLSTSASATTQSTSANANTPSASATASTLSTSAIPSTSCTSSTASTQISSASPTFLASGSNTVAPAPSSSPATEYPAWPSFPAAVPYDNCVVKYNFKYVYA